MAGVAPKVPLLSRDVWACRYTSSYALSLRWSCRYANLLPIAYDALVGPLRTQQPRQRVIQPPTTTTPRWPVRTLAHACVHAPHGRGLHPWLLLGRGLAWFALQTDTAHGLSQTRRCCWWCVLPLRGAPMSVRVHGTGQTLVGACG